MKRIVVFTIVAVLALSLASFAQNTNASSKATAAYSTAVACSYANAGTLETLDPTDCHDVWTGTRIDSTPDGFVPIMTAQVKVSNSQSLFVAPSLVTGLYTNTRTKTSTGTTGTTSTAQAMGAVYVRAVLLDSTGTRELAEAYPLAACGDLPDTFGCSEPVNGVRGVIFDSRVQTLSQTLSACAINGTTSSGDTVTGSCSFDLTTQLILQTASAHSFNFIFPNVGVGTYKVQIQAAVKSGASIAGSGTAIGSSIYGLGSMTVESVRLIHDFNFSF